MKILYLCLDIGVPVLGRKGASVHVRELVAALTRAGHTVVLAAPQLNKSPWEQPAELAGLLHRLVPGNHVATAALAVKELNEQLGAPNSLPGELRLILSNQQFGVELERRFQSDPPDFIYQRASVFGTAGVYLAREWRVPLLLELNCCSSRADPTRPCASAGDWPAGL